ncbi:RES domain-containing protein [Pedobacter helvus]|uniref:RES domain-containing protein n=1 Tax=Pedobacter helvus TaxID=2563444 RepID=A0ABW9JJ12_9SPHI|nr:RES domain-containing protein [Pedobacter ureilyticus]
MNLRNFLSDEYFLLPKSQPPKEDFKLFIVRQYDIFLEKLEALRPFFLFSDYTDFDISTIIERQTILVSKLKNAIEYIYDGKPNKAFQEVESGLNSNIKDFSEVLNVKEFPIDTNFYRMRYHRENYPLDNENFFHIPYQLRGMVSTQRFSIPGFPSLYLGNSVYVCWEELKRPNINNFQVARLKSLSELSVIDLSPPDESASSRDLYRYLMTWPLVVSCSVKVRNHEDSFKAEYIIPQLLLQWVRETQQVDGIAYQTTNIDYSSTLSKGKFTNFVLPVRENKIRGYCGVLRNKFGITSPVSVQLNQLADGSGSYTYLQTELENLNPNIERIEFIKGSRGIYGMSILGSLERKLNNMETLRIPIRD